MAASRVSDGDVRAVIETDPAVKMEPFIRRGHLVTQRLISHGASKGITVSAEEAAEIECLLAGHFHDDRDHSYQTKSEGRASASFTGQFGKRLERTRCGQDAMILDPTGYLMAISNGARVRVDWLGQPEATSSSDRGEKGVGE